MFENFVLTELVKLRLNEAKLPGLFFFRDRTGHEIDALLEEGGKLFTIEIKSARTPSSDFTKSLRYFDDLAPGQAAGRFVIYDGEEMTLSHDISFINWRSAVSRIRKAGVS